MDIDKIMPEAICVTVDRSGMQAVHDRVPIYHETSGKWIHVDGGNRYDLGLLLVSSSFEPSQSLEARPGREREVTLQKEALAKAKKLDRTISQDVDFPSQLSPSATDPKERGPDAPGVQ